MKETLNNIVLMAKRFRLATLSNLLGLVVAFASFYLIMTQIIYQVTYNHGIEDYEHLYRMETDFVYNEWQFTNNISRPLADALDSLPEVESYSLTLNTSLRYYEGMYLMNFKKGDRKVQYEYATGNNTAVSTLTSKVLDGSIEWTDDDQQGVIIPASIAKDYFGTTRAAGKDLLYCYTDSSGKEEIYPLKVRGVYEDFPEKSELTNRIIGNIGQEDQYSMNFVYNCIVKFKSLPTDTTAFNNAIKRRVAARVTKAYENYGYQDMYQDMINTHMASINTMAIKFTPLKDSYFEHNSFTTSDSGYKDMLIIMKLTCLLVLIIAAVNFLNFILAESPMRIAGLNTRRVLGASRHSLRAGIIRECVVTSVGACLLALAACYLIKFIPLTRRLTEGSLALTAHWQLVLLMLAIALILGLVVGIYPANFATSYSPSIILKGRFGLTPIGKRMRTVLVCLQLTISMLMVIYIGALYLQGRYIFNSHYGYDKDRILYTPLPYTMEPEKQDTLYQELMKIPGVECASFSSTALGTTDGHFVLRSEKDKQSVRYSYMIADYNYPATMGIDIIEGRSFSQDNEESIEVLVNEAARARWKWMQIGAKISAGIDDQQADSATVVGVYKDLRYGTTRIANDKPFFIIRSSGYNILNVRLTADADRKTVREQVNNLAMKVSGQQDIKTKFFDESLETTYKAEFRYINQMIIISIICLFITVIGIICMTYFETEFRRKEIGIRKVAGGTSWEVITMFCRHYAAILVISFLIAAPMAVKIIGNTLNYFDEQATVQWWIYPSGLLIVGTVTLGSVILQCWRSAHENPVDSIRDE